MSIDQLFRTALVIFPLLPTFPADIIADTGFIAEEHRFADRYSSWIADDCHAGLTILFRNRAST
ncbi:MAG: hypothetical protein OXE84_02190 [Rhodobacteraceae bacterium]|nr:hypothetical protein [Paracoccaceae bacterium]MCY4198006.1 hypothetical protein [Paracoccaceae bacterium]